MRPPLLHTLADLLQLLVVLHGGYGRVLLSRPMWLCGKRCRWLWGSVSGKRRLLLTVAHLEGRESLRRRVKRVRVWSNGGCNRKELGSKRSINKHAPERGRKWKRAAA